MIYPEGLAVSISAAAVAIAKGKSADEVSLIGTAFTQLGDTLTTIAVTRQLCENSQKDSQTKDIKPETSAQPEEKVSDNTKEAGTEEPQESS